MKPKSREVLAREAAARVAAASMPPSACFGRGQLWSVLELAHRRAKTGEEATAVVAVARREFCGTCPVQMACHQLAATSEYSGLAAGAAYDSGERMEASWVVPRPGRKKVVKAAS